VHISVTVPIKITENATQFYYKYGNIGKQFNFGRYTSNNNIHFRGLKIQLYHFADRMFAQKKKLTHSTT